MGKISRNSPCPCGSGKKYKKCCLEKDELKAREISAENSEASIEPMNEIEEPLYKGANFNLANKTVEACLAWGEAWERIKAEMPQEIKSLEQLDRFFCDDFLVYNCLQEYEMELGNAGVIDPVFNQKRLEFCQEFLALLPDSEPLVLENMRRAKAEALFSLGRADEGDHEFEALTKDFPTSPWPYIGWGDMYCGFRDGAIDLEKAEMIYRTGLAKKVVDKESILERLQDLKSKRSDCEKDQV